MAAPSASFGATAAPTVVLGSGNEENDPFAFTPIQLTTVTEQRGMHQKNSGPDEVQRPDILDDLCLGLLLQARVDRVIHGRAAESGPQATLVVFGFRFHGLHGNRRFKSATITVVFEDEKERGADYDPKVVALWPNGDFTLGEATAVQVEDTAAGEVGGNVDIPAGAPVVTVGAHFVRSWEKKKLFSRKRSSKLTGSIFLDFSVREHGPSNAVLLTLSEDDAAATSVVAEFRAAVLLERKNDTDVFTAKVKMTGKADFLHKATRTVRDVTPFAPANDPVRFKPGIQYLRPPTGSTAIGGNLSAKIADTELSADKLEGLAGLLSTTALTVAA
ncbi:hypothetical protein CORC01_00638 [Colletotrichum orchidophilum]|uniref:Uncharacterized protein n=1 Tax=Colletotrichum orchidophilum TaxID=1209926 RepID=A0A1G4BSA7_9PEZI|nr:uncharacterized protein CORC01_00638 [Colletotrichum orchidophilum]OHF04299.1 hypothetical protein CORC01_00638 [Colletotrichum orchidophilum]